ncbi:uncharacterized protein HHUB_4246 (plasmid) [Halobacterium hubeiense]|uniref:Uncharacterized protein n=1 Tax=Halobacterium hubeiense TaxID=1407499 RepID=A0A0U5H7F8_9EURY|nr:hypothetical protein [Halobacterium hubeiense]CQH63991.1 uncharacterized protein HHUB_4246 [Halobacterium hubeiense]
MSSDPAREEIKQLILEAKGPSNAISSREINEQVDVDSVGSFPQTREIVRELLMEGIPIASNTNGYYVIESEEQLADYVDTLDSRMTGIAERRYGILRAADQWDGDIEASDDHDVL